MSSSSDSSMSSNEEILDLADDPSQLHHGEDVVMLSASSTQKGRRKIPHMWTRIVTDQMNLADLQSGYEVEVDV